MKTTCGRRWLSLLLTLAMCLTLAPAVFAAEPAPTVTLNRTSLTMYMLELAEGDVTEQLTAKATSGNITLNGPIEWTSSDDKVATVNADGLVTAVGAGKVTITARYSYTVGEGDTAEARTVEAKCEVTVVEPRITDIRVTLDKTVDGKDSAVGSLMDLAAGSSVGLTAKVTPVWSDGGSHTPPKEAFENKLSFAWRTGGTVTSEGKPVLSLDPADKAAVTLSARGSGQDKVTVTVQYDLPGVGAYKKEVSCTVNVSAEMKEVKKDFPTDDTIVLEKGTTSKAKVIPDPPEAAVTWTSEGSVFHMSAVDAWTRTLTGMSPGAGKVRATIGSGDNMRYAEWAVEVSGLVPRSSSATVKQNGVADLPAVDAYGNAKGKTPRWESKDPNTVQISGSTIRGVKPGTATIAAYVGTDYETSVTVTVTSDSATTIGPITGFTASDTLRFSSYRSDFRNQANGSLSHLTGLYVDPAQGTLYYRYNTENGPEGVAQLENYYYNPTSRQRGLDDITFVPNPQYDGGEITITYTTVSNTNQNRNCRILIQTQKVEADEIYLNATHDYPAQFSSSDFNRICQQKYGASLDYVIFTLPPSSQGTLYTDYVSGENYGSRVTSGAQYRRQDLDKLSFVPNASYPGKNDSGRVEISYTARSVGSPGSVYRGKVIITVKRDSMTATDYLLYECSAGGKVTLDDSEFNNYWRYELDGSGTLNYIRFDSLPTASQGALYYRYRSASNTGSEVRTGTSYYYGSYSPRLDDVTFVPNKDYSGTVYIPFTGWSTNGDRFSGTIEIDVKGTGGSGNVWYVCAPGKTRDFSVSDFNRLSTTLTGRTLDYIQFQDLPNSSTQGSLYHNSSRITSTSRQYKNGSGSYRIQNLSFRAVSSFSGSVDIPFTGQSANGIPFDGILTIASTGSGSWDATIYYTTDSKTAAVFEREDFDDLSNLETDRDIRTVWFTDLPSGSEGSLYRNYYSSSSKGSKITSSSTSVSASELNRVAFVPASGFTGTVRISFEGRSTSSEDFYGAVEIEVGRASADVTARYTTRTAPVTFRDQDLRRSGYTLSSVKFTALPSSSEGRLYYRYDSPTRYEGEAGTGVAYRTGSSGSSLISDLTFVPRAGYTGTVYLPYTGTNSNGTTFDGEVAITVSPCTTSVHFNDMGGYSNQERAAVEYLYDLDVTRGISANRYGPSMSIGRGDFAVMVYKAFGFGPSGASGAFRDVPSNARYAEAVNALYSLGVVSGVGNGRFSPNASVSRQDAICMVHRAMRAVGWNTSGGSSYLLNSYSDGDKVSGYAKNDMINAVREGYLPTSGGKLSPASALSRVDMAQILHRVLTY